jgi:hypothetical protein
MAKVDYVVNEADMVNPFLLAAGEYVCVITESDYLDAKSGAGKHIVLKFNVVEGPSKGRVFTQRLGTGYNNSPVAQQIARRIFGEICSIAGHPHGVADTNQVHNIPMIVKLNVTKDQNGEDQNNIASVKKYSGSAPATAGSGEKIGVMPWQK